MSEHDGGAITSRLFAVYVDGKSGRSFRPPTEADYHAFQKAVALSSKWLQESSDVFPDESINPSRPYKNSRGVSAVTRIGCNTFGALYNRRQAIANLTFYRVLGRLEGSDKEFDEALQSVLSLAINRMVYQNTTVSRWDSSRTTIKGAFSKQALAVVWDYAEANPFSGASADWDGAIDWIVRFIEANRLVTNQAEVLRASATAQTLPSDSVDALVTDPPYFAAIPYADLSDFFYVWLRRGLQKIHPELFGSPLTEKAGELIVTNAQVADGGIKKDELFFQSGMTAALKAKRDAVKPGGIAVIVYAEGTTLGWEAVLAAIIDAGWIVTSSWPIDTEMANRTQAQGAASLQSSVHIVCRPREDQAGLLIEEAGEWRDVLAELPKRIHEWMPRLASEGVVGADAIFACLGPALEIFSRYSRIEKADGSVVPLKDYLEEVWSAVSTEALSMIFKDADAAGLEPDARLTAMWLWTIGGGTGKAGTNGGAAEVVPGMATEDDDELQPPVQSTSSSGFSLEFDAARKIAQGLGVHLEQSNSIVEVKGDKARLLPIGDRLKYLFGKDEATAATRARKKAKAKQRSLFEEIDALEVEADDTTHGELKTDAGKTVLDRVHQSMILFGSGRGEALRRFLVEDGAGKDARFWKLAQALSALYPPGTDEKRWVDGVLARKKGLGL